jgi:uncharacterized protein (TIGR02594 family)
MFFNIFNRQPVEPPWIVEGKKVFGLHESRNNAELRRWLVSDGKTLGDPKANPWCCDYVETAIKNTLPKEQFPNPLGQNLYWARNWIYFGVATQPCMWCVMVFSRDGGGHVGFAVGEDATDYYVLGGNQSDSVNIARISKSRLLGCRWPSTYKNPNVPLKAMSPQNIPKSTNEF